MLLTAITVISELK